MERTSPCYFTARDDGDYVVSYEIGNACNMNCLHCMNRSEKKAFPGLPGDTVKKLLSELWASGVKYLYISGGEPLIHPDFDEVIAYAHDLGFQMMLATNGLKVPEHIGTISRCVGDVSISLDGIGETHDTFRGTPGAFDGVMEAIRVLHEHGVYARISTCLWRENIGQLEDIVELANRLELGKINLSILVPTGRATENDVHIPWSEYPALLERIGRLQRENEDPSKVDIVLRRNRLLDCDSIDCIGGTCIYHINAYGRVSPCSWCSKSDVDDEFSMMWEPGNLETCVEKCRGISSLISARREKFGYSGCPAIAYFQHGGYMEEDPLNRMLLGGDDGE